MLLKMALSYKTKGAIRTTTVQISSKGIKSHILVRNLTVQI
jgi:hypothetical protein